MRVIGWSLILLAIIATVNNAIAASPVDDIRQQWIEAWNAKNADTLANLYADDAVLLTPNGQRVEGRDAIKTYFKAILGPATSANITIQSKKTESSGVLATDTGSYSNDVTQARGGVSMSGGVVLSGGVQVGGTSKRHQEGQYLVVAEKLNGKWLIILHGATEVPTPHMTASGSVQ